MRQLITSLLFTLCINSVFAISPVSIVELGYDCTSLSAAISHLKTIAISGDLTIKLNEELLLTDVKPISTQGINMNGHHLTIEGKSPTTKTRIVLNSTAAHVMDNYLSDFTLKDVVLRGANPLNSNGAVFRQQGNTQNIELNNVDLIGGYCGMRATSNITNLRLIKLRCENVTNGSLRLGNGDFAGTRKDSMLWERASSDFDMHDVFIDGLEIVAPNNNTFVPGTNKRFNGFLLLKMIDHLEIKNVKAPKGNGGSGISIENSHDVQLESVLFDAFGYNQSWATGISLNRCQKVKVCNTLLKTRVSDSHTHVFYYLNYVHDLEFQHNSAIAVKPYDKVFYGLEISKVEKFEANLFHMIESPVEVFFRTVNGYQASMANDWKSEDYNVFVNLGRYHSLLKLLNINGTEYDVRHIGSAAGVNTRVEHTTYKSLLGQGQNSAFDYPNTKVKYASPLHHYLDNGSLGRNQVTRNICNFDLNSDPRSNPTDVGAFDSENFSSISLNEGPKTLVLKSIFPNPANDELNVQLNEKIREAQVSILDQSGRVHKVFSINQVKDFKINLDLERGLYILHIQQKSETQAITFAVM